MKDTWEKGIVYATQNGRALPITEMPDEVFAEKVPGDGICILPKDGKVYAPVNGVVESADDTGHAYGIAAEDGADIMIHIGVDTVELAGTGFKRKVKPGQLVKAGDLICSVNLETVKKAGYSVHTAIVLCNVEFFTITGITADSVVQAGKTVIFRYERKNLAEP
ncbi:MAG: PTS glucose transporter subunit IIA [Treponema sp.]|jgi:glucose-specific phosphotransferase system IIA component|nr:PTS glucose transporter subunit IIA [Treponema sp.]